MRLLKTDTIEIQLFEYGDIPPYAILSHRWGKDELTYQDLEKGVKTKEGFKKVQQCCSRAKDDGFDYVWIDTCCIDKTSSAELSEAINSMYLWYYQAERCYAYLADVPLKSTFDKSEWFTRGWTLQELLAPSEVYFVDQDWGDIGTKKSLQSVISDCTGIPVNILCGEDDIETASIAQRMSWAAKRKTQRLEDHAYCLMGIFGINMPLLYGEGERAFLRLQEEIMKVSYDHSLFAWESSDARGGLLATSPEAFKGSGEIIRFNCFDDPSDALTISSKGVHLGARFVGIGPQGLGFAILHCKRRSGEDKPITIYARDLSGTMETFKRVKSEELGQFDRRKYKPSQYPMRRICIQTGRVTPLRKSKDSRKCDNAQYEVYDDDKLEKLMNFTSWKALFQAAETVSQDDIWLLLTRGDFEVDLKDKYGETPLCYAVNSCHEDGVKALLARGANFNTVCDHGTPLFLAVRKRHERIVELLLDKGADIDSKDSLQGPPLAIAASCGYQGVVQLLLERGAQVDLVDDSCRTPLSNAIEKGDGGIMNLLLNWGAEVNLKDLYNKTPLLWAVYYKRQAAVKLLLERGAEVDLGDDQGRTPLSLSIKKGDVGIINLLLERGAKVDVRDNRGQTPLSLAAVNGDEGIINLLLEWVDKII